MLLDELNPGLNKYSNKELYLEINLRGGKQPPLIKSGYKNDEGKTRWDLIDYTFWEDIARTLTIGATSHGGDYNWRDVERWRIEAALGRHISAMRRGERFDQEDGISHAAHAATNLGFLDWFDRQADETKLASEIVKVTESPPEVILDESIKDCPEETIPS